MQMTPNYVCPHLVVVPRLCSSASDHEARLVRDQHAMVRKVGVGRRGERHKRGGDGENGGESGAKAQSMETEAWPGYE